MQRPRYLKWLSGFFIIALLNTNVIAQSLNNDFAYQSQLSESDEALQSVHIPLEVLTGLVRDDFGDLKVRDASGKTLPSWIRQLPIEYATKQTELDFYEFSAYINTRSKTVTTRENPSLTSTEVLPVQTTRQDYIIELTEQQQGQGINQLALEWSQQPVDQILQLKIEVADDIDHWYTIHASKNLSNKLSDNLDWSQIKNIPKGKKYIRLTPANSMQSFTLLKVVGFYGTKSSHDYLWHSSKSIALQGHADFYRLELPSSIYPDQLRLIPAQSQQLIKGDLYASQLDFDKKRRIQSNIQQHNIQPSEQVTVNQAIDVSHNLYQKWWFKSDQKLDAAPTVEFAYSPTEVLFLSNNNGPFTLVWGNYEASAPANDLIGLLSKREQLQSTSGQQVELNLIENAGGTSRLQAQAQTPWLKWLLWLFLALAVVITARMALSLYKDMKPA